MKIDERFYLNLKNAISKLKSSETKSNDINFDLLKENTDNDIKDNNQKQLFHFLNIKLNKKNINLSPRIKKINKTVIKNIHNLNLENNKNNSYGNFDTKNESRNNQGAYYMGVDLPENNRYFSDLIYQDELKNVNDTNKEKEDMETVDNKIYQLAKDLKLFQNNKYNRSMDLKKNYSNGDLLCNKKSLDEGYINLLPKINSLNSVNISSNFSPRIRVPSGIQSAREYSSKRINDSYNINPINNFLYRKKINRLNSPRNFISKRNIISPLSKKEKDNFLYNKIFAYFGPKKMPNIMKRFLDNKLNICYAEDEKQFEKKIIEINENNRIKGKSVNHKIGKSESELRASSLQKKIEFIKQVCDYAYPDIVINKIKYKSDFDKRIIKENALNKLIKEKKILNKKIKANSYIRNIWIQNSVNIQRV
jgi:hypothetical protein